MLEHTILSELIYNEEYLRKSLPFIKNEYFQESDKKTIFDLINSFVDKYNNLPTKESLLIELDALSINEDVFDKSKELIESLEKNEDLNLEWLLDQTEKFCQEKAIYNAIHQSIMILDGKDKSHAKTAIPEILSDALGVSFDTNIGHDYFDDAEARFDGYNSKEIHIPTGLYYIDKITQGGFPRASLNGILGGVNVGKTAILSDFAAIYLQRGLNVLYITLEDGEQKIAKRIEQNLLDLTHEELLQVDKFNFMKKIKSLQEKTQGKLKIKEYPGASVGASHFRYLLGELRQKKKFIPDVIIIDYLNLCTSNRFKKGAIDLYGYVKAVSEELRGLMAEYNVVGITASQFNRTGFASSDPNMDEIADSFGTAMTLDFLIAAISSEELEKAQQLLFKQIKNRYRNKALDKRFLMGFNIEKQRLYDVETTDQFTDDTPVFDKSSTNEKLLGKKKEINSDIFEGFR